MMGLIAGALGALVLAGWVFNLAVLKSIFPGLVTMKANTAMGMLLCGGALAILSRTKASTPSRYWAALLAVVVTAFGALSLGESLSGWDFGIDQWLFRDADFRVGITQPGRMSPATAFCFVLTGVSLLVASQPASMRLRRSILAAQGLTLIIVSGLAFAGYASDALFNFRWWSYTGMAVHTAAGFMVLGVGLLALGWSGGGLKWSLDALTTAGFAIGIAMLLGAAGVAYHFTLQLQESAAWVSHTQEVLRGIEGISAGVASIGSSQRSYINTGDDRFLAKEATVRTGLHQSIATLLELTADNPRQKPRLNQLDPLIDERIDWGEQTIAARRKEGLSVAEQMIATGKGIELTDGIRHLIKALEDEEYALLDQRQKREKAISTTTFLLLPLGVFLSVTLLSLGLFVLNTGMGERAQAQEKAAWLASFPEDNPSPIVELDLATGIIHYLNPFARRLLPDLQSRGMDHPWLSGLAATAKPLTEGNGEPVTREIAAGGLVFTQAITYIAHTKRVRVYGADITERKRAEEAAARLATIVEFSDDAIIGKDLRGIVTSWNGGAERLFGYAAEEMLGEPMMRLFPHGLEQEETDILRRIQRGERVKAFDTERVRKDGSIVAIAVSVSPIKDSKGRVIGASKMARDISERKQVEKALRDTQARLHSTLAAGSIGTWTWDILNDRLVADEFTARLFSINADAAANGLPADNYLQAVFEKDRQSVADALASSIKSCGHYDIEYRVRQENGELRWLKARGRVDGDAAGNAARFHGAVMDITDLKRTEARVRRLVDSGVQGVMFWNSKGEITASNDAFLHIVGYTREDLESGRLGWAAITPPEYAPLDDRSLKELAATGIATPFEKEYWRKDGSRVPVLLGAATFEDRPDEGVCFVLDITERREAQEKINRLNTELEHRVSQRTAQLEAANKELEAFSYSVSHDLRAPLRSVDGFSQAVLEDYGPLLPQEGRDDLQLIRNGAQRMGRLIDDLLTFSRLSRQPLRKSEVNTGVLVRVVLEELNYKQKERDIDVRIAELAACQADPALLKQVWINLLSNALKYSGKRDSAVIEIGCAEENGHSVYFVRDNGTGFDMRYAHKLFGVFQRLHRAEDYEGTGVGLAIVQRVVNRHGGRIWAESEVNLGATFYFTLNEENPV